MLELKNITITTHKGRVLIKDFSFVLNKYDKIAIIGEEGNGKSTLLKSIVDLSLVNEYVKVEGFINKNKLQLGYLEQALDPLWDECEVFEFLVKDEPQEEVKVEKYNDFPVIVECLGKVHCTSEFLFENKKMKTCSGGEKVKLQLAKLLYNKPDVLLLDEPTNDLDLKTLIWLEEFIKTSGLAVLFISHDETLLENCATGIIHIEQLKRKTESMWTMEHVGYTDYCASRSHLINRVNRIAAKEKSEYKKQLERYRHLYQRVDHELNTVSRQDAHGGQLLKKKMKSVKSLGKRLENKELVSKREPEEAINLYFDDFNMNANKIICDCTIDELKMGERVLCTDIHLLVKGTEHVVLIGQNGTGKSTLLKQLYQMLSARSDIKVGYCPQNYGELLYMNQTPVEYLLSDIDFSMKSKIQSYLGSLKFTPEEMDHTIESLSYGQRCKVLLVYLIIHKFNVLILDEPTRNMSSLSTPIIRKIFNDFNGCIISVSHDRKFIDEVCDTVYEIKNGKLCKLD